MSHFGVHEWSRVPAGLYHDFHESWALRIRDRLNGGILPDTFYSLVEQRTNAREPDVLTLRESDELWDSTSEWSGTSEGGTSGGLMVLDEVATAVDSVQTYDPTEAGLYAEKADLVTVRHVSGDVPVATIELISPGNKDRPGAVADFCKKTLSLIDAGRHVLVVDPLPPTPSAPDGIHAKVWSDRFDSEAAVVSEERPLCLVSYRADRRPAGFVPEAYFTAAAINSPLPDMPVFLTAEQAVSVPLAAAYDDAWETTPRRIKQIVTESAAST